MKYAIIKIVNGNFFVHSEHGDDKNAAIMEWHNVCRTLRNSSDVEVATVEILNEKGGQVDAYYEYIKPENV